jgi:hypothetical protein
VVREEKEFKMRLDNRKSKTGGVKPGAGRPKGAKNINSMASVKKLEELGFDPISKMVEQYDGITKIIASGEVRVGSGAHAQLIATQGNLINNLMQYGYKRVPERIEQEITEKQPVAVRLNFKSNNEKERELK